MLALNPSMRISTLATFDDVSTIPQTNSPPRGVVELNAIHRISGGASGGNMSTVGVAAGLGNGATPVVGEAVDAAAADGSSDGEGAGWPGHGIAETAGVGDAGDVRAGVGDGDAGNALGAGAGGTMAARRLIAPSIPRFDCNGGKCGRSSRAGPRPPLPAGVAIASLR